MERTPKAYVLLVIVTRIINMKNDLYNYAKRFFFLNLKASRKQTMAF